MFGLHPAMAPLRRSGTPASWPRSRPPGSRSPTGRTSRPSRRSRTPHRLRGAQRLDQPDDRPRPHAGTLDAVQLGMNFPTTALVGPEPDPRHQRPRRPPGPRARRHTHASATRSLETAWAGATGPLAIGRRARRSPSPRVPAQKLATMADSDGRLPDRVERLPVRRAAEERRQADQGRRRHRRDRHRRRQLGPAHQLRHPPVGQHAVQHRRLRPVAGGVHRRPRRAAQRGSPS